MLFIGKTWFEARLKDSIEQQAEVSRSRFQLKRKACLEALSVIDASYSQKNWKQDGKPIKVQKQKIDIAKAREFYNKLALTCDDPGILHSYLNALGVGVPHERSKCILGDAIVDVRERMRKELGFGNSLELPREKAWIGDLKGADDNQGE